MGIGDRLKRFFKSEANAAIDKAEDSTKISQQIVREFGDKLQEATESSAQVKSIALKNRANLTEAKDEVTTWEQKVNIILDRIDKEGSSEELEKLAGIAAGHYDEFVKKVKNLEQIVNTSDAQADAMENTVRTLQHKIEEAKDKSKNIEARQKVAEASKTVNMAMSSANTDGLMSTLDRMEENVSKTEFIAEAYAQTNGTTSDEAKIDEFLAKTSTSSTLDAFRAKRQQK